MADIIDLANDLIDNEVSRALNKLRPQSQEPQIGSEFCLECGDTMPSARQQHGFNLCKSCAEEAEKRKSQYADN